MWTVATVVFFMYFVAPHDVARLIAGRQASPETVAAVSRDLGLDRPVAAQYGSFLVRLLHGDLGYSYTNSEPVTSLIGQALPVTVLLSHRRRGPLAFARRHARGRAARRRRSVVDRTTTGVALVFYSMPTFLLGELLLLGLFYQLHLLGIDLFPGGGYVPLTQNPAEWAQHLLLPWLTIALVSAATYSRLTRASLLDVLGEDYIRTARQRASRAAGSRFVTGCGRR